MGDIIYSYICTFMYIFGKNYTKIVWTAFHQSHHNFIQRQKEKWKVFVNTLPVTICSSLMCISVPEGSYSREEQLLHVTSKNPLSAFNSWAYSVHPQQRVLWNNNLIIYVPSVSVVIWGCRGISELWRWETIQHILPRKDQWNGGGRR